MATENVIMECVKRGGDRQELHEEIRTLSMQAGEQVKKFGNPNDLLERMTNSKIINLSSDEINLIVNPKNFVGRAPEQVVDFYEEVIKDILEENKSELGIEIELNV